MGDKREKEYVIDRIKIDGRDYIIKLNDHSLYRINKNNIEISDVDKLVKRAIPFAPLDSVTAKDRFEVIDAETCLFVAFGIFRGDRVSSVFIKTSYIWDGKSPLSRICLILNKSTASDEFLEAQDIANAYGHTYTNGGNASYEPEKSFIPKNFDLSYKKDGKTNLNFGEPTSLKGWEKYHDPERPEIKKYVDDLVTKRNQGQSNWMQRNKSNPFGKSEDERNEQENEYRKKGLKMGFGKMDYDESKREKEKRKQQRDLEKYLDAADKEILTPRGPNGSLRGIDKKRKKNNKTNKNESKNMSKKNTIRLTESDLKRVISESVKRVLTEATVSENQLADRTYPLIGDLIDEWDNICDNTGRYSETATRVVGALQNVLNVLRDISREHKEKGMSGYDFSRFPRPDDAGYDW